jgi:Protein of unknown function DUF262
MQIKDYFNEENTAQIDIEGEDENDNEIPVVHYDITSYGIDYDVEGLVKRLERKTIIVPEFQRNFVWKLPESSRFIESLLLGLPVPGIFLAQESDTGKLNIIDGQQRLLTLQYFFQGYFKPRKDATTNRLFRLTGVQKTYDGLNYEELPAADKENLNNSVIHATVIKQDSPDDGDSSMYHIFGRLNSGGRRLTPQEIRTAVYHGTLVNTLKLANDHSSWRQVFGPENDRMKDQELVLRFFAMLERADVYKKPMSEFLNTYCKLHRKRSSSEWQPLLDLFGKVIDQLTQAVPEKLFRPVRAFNVAAFEACSVGLAHAIAAGKSHTSTRLAELYAELLAEPKFKESIFASTSDVTVTADRLKIAIQILSKD